MHSFCSTSRCRSEGRASLRPQLVAEEVDRPDPERRHQQLLEPPGGGLSPATEGGRGPAVPALPPAWDDRGGPSASATVRGPGIPPAAPRTGGGGPAGPGAATSTATWASGGGLSPATGGGRGPAVHAPPRPG